MTRRARITTVEEADAAMERLGWLRAQGTPNAAVRELYECATAYRAAVHRQGGVKEEPGHVARLEKKRS
jgi:hypothetical protein